MVVAGALRIVALALAVMMVVMLVLVVVMVMLMIMVVMMVLVLVLILVMIMIVMMVMLMRILVMLVVVMMMVMMLSLLGLVLGPHLLQQLVGQGHLLHGGQNGLAVQLVPGGGQDGGGGVLLPQQGRGGLQLLLGQLLGPGQDDGAGGLDLVVIELAEVLHIHLHLAGVGHGDKGVQPHIRNIRHGVLHRHDDVAELAHAGGLDEDAVRLELLLYLPQGLAEVAHQGAADAARGHFGDLDTGVLQKAAVDADLAELVFDQHQLLALICLLHHLLDEGGLTCAQETGHDVNFCHNSTFFSSPAGRDIFFPLYHSLFFQNCKGRGKNSHFRPHHRRFVPLLPGFVPIFRRDRPGRKQKYSHPAKNTV